MKRSVWVLALLAGLLACTASGDVHVEDAWSRPASAAANGAVFMMVVNGGQETDRLTGAASEVAETVEIHRTIVENEVMRMEPVPYVEVPAGEQVEFKPGSYHVMLIGLRQDLAVGDHFQVTLMFESGGSLTVDAHVREP